jgi:hypothetical protein
MKTIALLLSEVPSMQGAHARRDGVLFQPWSGGVPPWAEFDRRTSTPWGHGKEPNFSYRLMRAVAAFRVVCGVMAGGESWDLLLARPTS